MHSKGLEEFSASLKRTESLQRLDAETRELDAIYNEYQDGELQPREATRPVGLNRISRLNNLLLQLTEQAENPQDVTLQLNLTHEEQATAEEWLAKAEKIASTTAQTIVQSLSASQLRDLTSLDARQRFIAATTRTEDGAPHFSSFVGKALQCIFQEVTKQNLRNISLEEFKLTLKIKLDQHLKDIEQLEQFTGQNHVKLLTKNTLLSVDSKEEYKRSLYKTLLEVAQSNPALPLNLLIADASELGAFIIPTRFELIFARTLERCIQDRQSTLRLAGTVTTPSSQQLEAIYRSVATPEETLTTEQWLAKAPLIASNTAQTIVSQLSTNQLTVLCNSDARQKFITSSMQDNNSPFAKFVSTGLEAILSQRPDLHKLTLDDFKHALQSKLDQHVIHIERLEQLTGLNQVKRITADTLYPLDNKEQYKQTMYGVLLENAQTNPELPLHLLIADASELGALILPTRFELIFAQTLEQQILNGLIERLQCNIANLKNKISAVESRLYKSASKSANVSFWQTVVRSHDVNNSLNEVTHLQKLESSLTEKLARLSKAENQSHQLPHAKV